MTNSLFQKINSSGINLLSPNILLITYFLFSVTVNAQDKDTDNSSLTAETAGDTEPKKSAYYGDITVKLIGLKNSTGEKFQLAGHVLINGTHVGETPYKDGLPFGVYQISILYNNATYKSKPISIYAGQNYEYKVQVEMPLTREEIAQRNKQLQIEKEKKLKEQAELEKKQQIQKEKELQEQAAYFDNDYKKWKKENDKIIKKRKPLIISGSILIPAGVGMTIAGSIFLGKMHNLKSDYDNYFYNFSYSTNPSDIAYYKDILTTLDSDIKKNKVAGAILLPTGIVSVITGIVLLSVVPKKKSPPVPDPFIEPYISITALSPVITDTFKGIALGGTF